MAVEAPSVRAAPEYTVGWARVVDIIRWLLVAVLLVDIAAGLLAQPRRSELSDLRRDLATGNVRSITFASHDGVRYNSLTSGRFRTQDIGSVVLWRVGAVDYRVANLRGSAPFSGRENDGRYPLESRQRSQISRAAGLQAVPVHQGGHDLLLLFPGVGIAVFLLLVLVLFVGGQPRTATRWATFWMLMAPMNLGALRTLLRESPWSAQARARPEPLPHRMMPDDERLTGGGGFLRMLLCYIAVALATAALAAVRW